MTARRVRSRVVRRVYGLAVTLALAACTVGPDWQRPKVETPPAWRIEYEQAAEVANTRWWEAYGDPVLNQLVDDALRENRDLVQAAARVDQFLGALRTTRSQFYPQIGYNGEASRNRASENGPVPLTPGSDRNYTLYQAALGASWQIDLFGRVRRQAESAQAQVYASEQGRRGVVLSVVTSVATSYIALRALDRQLEISRATAKNYAGSLQLFELRHKGGAVSEVERSQVESQYQQAQAAVPSFERQVGQQEDLLSVLLGRNPGDIPRGKSIEELLDPPIPPDLPASLLERRPDVVQAEHNLHAVNAQIGVAKSLYYPTLSLTGLLGLSSTSLSDFAKGSSGTGYLAATLAGPIFTFGNIEGQVKSAEAAQREALAFYQQVVLNAFRETNDALIGVAKRRDEYDALAKRVVALRTYARLSRARYEGGTASYIEVLYAENELFSAELTAVSSLADRHADLVNVYKALGGGWVDAADPLAPKPEEPVSAQPTAAKGGAATPAPVKDQASSASASQDRVASSIEGQASVVDIYRVIGTGGVQIQAPASGWPQGVDIRLHGFKSLPDLSADASGRLLTCMPAQSGTTASYDCRLGNTQRPAARTTRNYVEVSLPREFLTADTPRIQLRWSERAVVAQP
jgi:multidrug efflux system outer membrane protein